MSEAIRFLSIPWVWKCHLPTARPAPAARRLNDEDADACDDAPPSPVRRLPPLCHELAHESRLQLRLRNRRRRSSLPAASALATEPRRIAKHGYGLPSLPFRSQRLHQLHLRFCQPVVRSRACHPRRALLCRMMPQLCARSFSPASPREAPYPWLRPSGSRQRGGTAAPDSQPRARASHPESAAHPALCCRATPTGGGDPSRRVAALPRAMQNAPRPLLESLPRPQAPASSRRGH